MALGDLDGDDYIDIYLTIGSAGDEVWLNDSTGVFVDSGQRVGPATGHGHAELADLDGDGDLDAFVTNSGGGSRLYLNDGLGLLSDSGQTLGTRAQKIHLLDIDLDGDLDAITTHMDDGNPIWLNDGAGTFSSAGQVVDDLGVISVASGDVDANNTYDVFVGKLEGAGGNGLYFNRTGVPVRTTTWGKVKDFFDRR
jgi:hypothetical protein